MADKKLNEVTKVTDMAYVPVIMADGSVGQIAKADLASVVAGLISPIKNKGHVGSVNIDDYRDCFGYYNSNSGEDFSGTFISFGTTSPVQIRFRYDGLLNQYRVYNPTSYVWTSWKNL